MKTLRMFFLVLLVFFSPPVLAQDGGIYGENDYEFGYFFGYNMDSLATRNFIVEDEFGNHFQSFDQFGGTHFEFGNHGITGAWYKIFQSFATPDSIFIEMKSGFVTNTTSKIFVNIGFQSPDGGWVLLGSEYKQILIGEEWTSFSFNMAFVKTILDSINMIQLYFSFVAEDSCYVGGVVLIDNMVRITNGNVLLIDGFGDNTITGIEISEIELPTEFALEQNYPNPFNPSTKIKFTIPQREQVSLIVFNSLGEEVKILLSEEKDIGNYEVEFNASKLPSGVYFYRLQAGSFVETKKMTLVK